MPSRAQLEAIARKAATLRSKNAGIKARGGNVKLENPNTAVGNKEWNRWQDMMTKDAKSGATARENAKSIKNQNSFRRNTGRSTASVVKVDSNPSPKRPTRGSTRIGNLAGGRGGAGMGGLLGNRIR